MARPKSKPVPAAEQIASRFGPQAVRVARWMCDDFQVMQTKKVHRYTRGVYLHLGKEKVDKILYELRFRNYLARAMVGGCIFPARIVQNRSRRKTADNLNTVEFNPHQVWGAANPSSTDVASAFAEVGRAVGTNWAGVEIPNDVIGEALLPFAQAIWFDADAGGQLPVEQPEFADRMLRALPLIDAGADRMAEWLGGQDHPIYDADLVYTSPGWTPTTLRIKMRRAIIGVDVPVLPGPAMYRYPDLMLPQPFDLMDRTALSIPGALEEIRALYESWKSGADPEYRPFMPAFDVFKPSFCLLATCLWAEPLEKLRLARERRKGEEAVQVEMPGEKDWAFLTEADLADLDYWQRLKTWTEERLADFEEKALLPERVRGDETQGLHYYRQQYIEPPEGPASPGKFSREERTGLTPGEVEDISEGGFYAIIPWTDEVALSYAGEGIRFPHASQVYPLDPERTLPAEWDETDVVRFYLQFERKPPEDTFAAPALADMPKLIAEAQAALAAAQARLIPSWYGAAQRAQMQAEKDEAIRAAEDVLWRLQDDVARWEAKDVVHLRNLLAEVRRGDRPSFRDLVATIDPQFSKLAGMAADLEALRDEYRWLGQGSGRDRWAQPETPLGTPPADVEESLLRIGGDMEAILERYAKLRNVWDDGEQAERVLALVQQAGGNPGKDWIGHYAPMLTAQLRRRVAAALYPQVLASARSQGAHIEAGVLERLPSWKWIVKGGYSYLDPRFNQNISFMAEAGWPTGMDGLRRLHFPGTMFRELSEESEDQVLVLLPTSPGVNTDGAVRNLRPNWAPMEGRVHLAVFPLSLQAPLEALTRDARAEATKTIGQFETIYAGEHPSRQNVGLARVDRRELLAALESLYRRAARKEYKQFPKQNLPNFSTFARASLMVLYQDPGLAWEDWAERARGTEADPNYWKLVRVDLRQVPFLAFLEDEFQPGRWLCAMSEAGGGSVVPSAAPLSAFTDVKTGITLQQWVEEYAGARRRYGRRSVEQMKARGLLGLRRAR